jgi:pimeloyl-ACP methyl ester carboxylesterase
MRSRPLAVFMAVVLVAGGTVYVAAPYVQATSLFVRAAHVGGRTETLANAMARPVTALPRHTLPTRQGDVAAQWYRPEGRVRRSALLVPGVHSMGIAEPRLTALAKDLAGSGVAVMTMALPDLIGYEITARSADVIEDAVGWMAAQPDVAPDGRVGMVGISFAGGLSIVAAGRPSIRDKVAYVVSFGGHGDLGRVLHYLATGEAVQAPGVVTHPPHDYGVAVILYALADRVVPPEQVAGLRQGIGTFLLASQLTLVNMDQANATFEKARGMVKALPQPSARLLTYVNDRNVGALGPILVPHLSLEADPAASPERAPLPPAAPVFLLHGDEDVVIPTAESVVLAEYLRRKGVDVRMLISQIITHAELDRSAAVSESWKLVSFWADVLRR